MKETVSANLSDLLSFAKLLNGEIAQEKPFLKMSFDGKDKESILFLMKKQYSLNYISAIVSRTNLKHSFIQFKNDHYILFFEDTHQVSDAVWDLIRDIHLFLSEVSYREEKLFNQVFQFSITAQSSNKRIIFLEDVVSLFIKVSHTPIDNKVHLVGDLFKLLSKYDQNLFEPSTVKDIFSSDITQKLMSTYLEQT